MVDEHAFPQMGFAVAWLGCSLHLYKNKSVVLFHMIMYLRIEIQILAFTG